MAKKTFEDLYKFIQGVKGDTIKLFDLKLKDEVYPKYYLSISDKKDSIKILREDEESVTTMATLNFEDDDEQEGVRVIECINGDDDRSNDIISSFAINGFYLAPVVSEAYFVALMLYDAISED